MGKARTKAERRGHFAETIALIYLRLKGYRLLAMRYKTPQGEVDLIMRRRDVTAFIEVKARRSRDEGVTAVTNTQSRRDDDGFTHAARRSGQWKSYLQRR